MPVIVKELVLRIRSEQPEPRPAPATADHRMGLGPAPVVTDDAAIREAVAQTLRILREKKER